VLCAGGKLEFFQGSKAAALPLRSVLYDCPAPFTEKQIALVFGRELPLELTEPASRRAEAEVRQRRQRFVRPLLVEIRVAVIGAEKAVADADHVSAAIVLVVAHKNIHPCVEGYVVDIA